MASMDSTSASKREDAAIRRALRILKNRIREPGEAYTSPDSARQYLTLKLAKLEREVFTVLFLDNRHRLIADAVIVAHNHPSGCPMASRADIEITRRLKEAPALVDHFIIGGTVAASLAEMGWELPRMSAPASKSEPKAEKPKRRRSKAA